MKLSYLAYQVVKNVMYHEDAGFTYDAYLSGEYDADQDYANNINNAYAPINEALHRLSDMEKVAYKVAFCGTPDNQGILELAPVFSSDGPGKEVKIKKIVSVFRLVERTYVTASFREMGKDKVLLDGAWRGDYYVQFAEDIPFFKPDDVDYFRTAEETFCQKDIDLEEYGITDTMCSYVIEYASGKLQEPIAPELSNMHITRAEQYFDDLPEQQTAFRQARMKRRYSING